jgi:hypothetical protein
VATAVTTWQLSPEHQSDDVYRVPFPQPAIPLTITLSPPPLSPAIPPRLAALSLVDNRDNTFQSLVPGNYRLIHSGDVKIYENLDALPRAYLVDQWQWQPDVATSVTAMQGDDFVVGETAVLIAPAADPHPESTPAPSFNGTVTISQDEPEQLVIRTNSPADSLLILSDAYYPGWQATIDGKATTLYQANAYFRGVLLPAGQHEVVFAFAPESFRNGRLISLISLGAWLFLMAVCLWADWPAPSRTTDDSSL